jgi:predicted lipoprotein with Yx(FWY)xxD motif
MTRSKPITILASAAVLPLIALAVAACGGGGGVATASPASAPAKTATAHTQATTVRVANSSLGRILVDSSGRTLYLFKADSSTRSACYGKCAIAWPPLQTRATPAVAGGAKASLVGTISRSDGTRQVTYHGHPLYLFVKDHKPGDVNGQGKVAFGAAWFAVSPAGKQISSRHIGHGNGSASSRQPAPAAPPVAKAPPAPTPTSAPAPTPAPKAAPPAANPAPPVAKPVPPVANPAPPANGIPQHNGGDGDSDNNGAPSDGDGNI